MAAELSFLYTVPHVVDEKAAGAKGDPDQHDPAGEPFLLRREVEIHGEEEQRSDIWLQG